MAVTNPPPSSRQQAEALIMEADAQGIVVMFRDDLVDILVKEIERADRAEQAAKEAYTKVEFALQFVHATEGFTFPDGDHWDDAGSKAKEYCPTEANLTAARERIAELEGERERGIFVVHFDSRTVHPLGERCATCPPA